MKTFLTSLFLLSSILNVNAQTQVTIYTNMGNFKLELNETLAPITAGNFKTLVNQKYYDGVIFHRVINNFMIQGGDPTGTGTGGPGYTIADEFHDSLSNLTGTISMANSGPNTGGSQFFINLVDNAYLDYNKAPLTSKHAVFGKVIENFTVVQSIGQVPVNAQNRPLTEVVMDSVRVTEAVGIESLNQSKSIRGIFPNPIIETTLINLNIETAEHTSLSIYSIEGKLVVSKNYQFTNGLHSISLHSLLNAELNSGVYFLKIESETRSETAKFIVK